MSTEIVTNALRSMGDSPELYVKSPGRINLLGEHTDYNQGLVLPASIDKHMVFAFSKSKAHNASLMATDFDEIIEFNLEKLENPDKGWAKYIWAILTELFEKGINMPGFKVAIQSSIPLGAGVSSSAALCCGLISGLNELFN